MDDFRYEFGNIPTSNSSYYNDGEGGVNHERFDQIVAKLDEELKEIDLKCQTILTRLQSQEQMILSLNQRFTKFGYSSLSEDLVIVKKDIAALAETFANSTDFTQALEKLNEKLVRSNLESVIAGRKGSEDSPLNVDAIVNPLAAWINQIFKSRMQFKFFTLSFPLTSVTGASLLFSVASLLAITMATVSLTVQLYRLEARLLMPTPSPAMRGK